jgi:hypothetical protein
MLLVGDTPDGGRSSLLGYSATTGALTPLIADVAPRLGGFDHLYAFQHPDLVSGDLLLLSTDLTSALPLHARAHLATPFFQGGNRIAFVGGSNTGESNLVAAKLDGSGTRIVGPAPDQAFFSPDGNHVSFQARGLVWIEDPGGPAAALDEVGRVPTALVSATGDGVIYSVSTGDRRGTYQVRLTPSAPSAPGSGSSPWRFSP